MLLVLGLAWGLFSLDGSPGAWRDVGPADGSEVIKLRVALQQSNLEWLRERFEAVSDPDDKDYGKHLCRHAINKKLEPPAEVVSKVEAWLAAGGVERSEWDRTNVDSIKLRTTVSVLGKLFPSLVFRAFKHAATNATITAAQGSLRREHVPSGIELITGLAFFPTKRQTQPAPPRAVDEGAVGPSSLYRLYNIDESVYPLSTTQGVVEFLGTGAYMPYYLSGGKGYKSFFSLAGIPEAEKPTIIGPFKPDEGELESSLDIEYLLAVGRGAKTVYWTEERWMYEFGNDFFNKGTDMSVVSISYSWSEVSQCLQPSGQPNPTCRELGVDSKQYVERTNTEFMKIGATGVTLVVSSGDDGAPGNLDGAKCSSKLPFDSQFPASSPYVTTVGGTMVKRSHDKQQPVQTLTQRPASTYKLHKPVTTGAKTVTQKICHDSKCTEKCSTTQLPVGECLVSEDGKNSATVACRLGLSVVETIYAGSKNCEGFAQKETIECNTCLIDTAGTYVWFECGFEDRPKAVPAPVPKPAAKVVTQMICKDDKCTKGCQTSKLPTGRCLVSEDGKNSATVGCKFGGLSIVETIYAGSKKCEGFAQKETIPCGQCLIDTAGTYVKFKCGDHEGEEGISELCVQNGGCITGSDEVVATYPTAGITSGGGFSVYSPRPAYQDAAVQGYLAKGGLPPANRFNAPGRGYPDVAAVAHNYAVWMAMWMPTDGTSAATPVVAGIFSIVNDQMARTFKDSNTTAKLGFVNPLLYKLAASNPAVFYDVTEGNNKCSSTCCGKAGFSAAVGWDPVSGLGTLNTAELIKASVNAKRAHL